MGVYTGLKSVVGPLLGVLLTGRLRLPARLFELRIASVLGNPTSERIIEYPWALNHLKRRKKERILDVGCGPGGLLASYLLSKGCDVYGLDIVKCQSLPTERFLLRDARKTGLPDSSFDIVILLSTLEHIGSDEQEDDVRTIRELSRILRKGGLILFSTPFAEEYSNRGQRFFSAERLSRVTEGFKILEERYFVQVGSKWDQMSIDGARNSTRGYTGVDTIAIVTLVLQKI